MRKSTHITIQDRNYTITQLPLVASRKLLFKLFKVLGPAFGDALNSSFEESSLDITSFGSAIRTLAMTLTEDDFVEVQNALIAGVTFTNDDGHEVPLKAYLDKHFDGDLGGLFRLLAECLKVNYADFLDGAGLSGFVKLAEQAKVSPNT